MNDLEKYFAGNVKGRFILKWDHYFEVYEQYFAKFRNTEVVFLEIGVFQGGSLQMWKDYFGPKARIYAVDINPLCKSLEEPQIEIFIGDQSDPKFLQDLVRKVPQIDIVLDDGGHTMEQQINSFKGLFPHVNPSGGIYIIEDTHSSYSMDSGGGLRRRSSFIEFSKNFVDYLHVWSLPGRKRAPKALEFGHSTKAVHYYNGMVVVEKEKRKEPRETRSGVANPSIELVSKTLPARLKKLSRLVRHHVFYKPYHKS